MNRTKKLLELHRRLIQQISRVPGYTEVILKLLTLESTERNFLLEKIVEFMEKHIEIRILDINLNPWPANLIVDRWERKKRLGLDPLQIRRTVVYEFKCGNCEKTIRESIYPLMMPLVDFGDRDGDSMECKDCLRAKDDVE